MKFRIWNKVDKKWFIRENGQDVLLSPDGVLINCSYNEVLGKCWDIYQIQLYSGLQDVNGKDIYEGDIVVWIDELKYVLSNFQMKDLIRYKVVFNEGSFWVEPMDDKVAHIIRLGVTTKEFLDDNDMYKGVNPCMIIGNIFEDMNNNDIKLLINLTREVAKEKHYGQFRFDGKTPYFEGHVEPVANAVEDRLKPIAYSHDLVEDTDVTLDDLRRLGYPRYVLDAVDLLTKKPNQEYWMYLQNMVHNPDAVKVKIEDIKHNMSGKPTKKTREKYVKALEFFKQHGYNV